MLKKYKWKILECPDEFSKQVLVDDLKLPPAIAKILVLREIDSYRKVKQFFEPSLQDLHDPFLMKGMRDAVKRIIKALTNNEKIMIYGDYDVDGTNASAMLYLFLKDLDGNVEIYIPNRMTEGYGISLTGLNEARNKKVSLVVAVDCGITAVEESKYANENEIDLIICDHHEPGEKIPEAVAVLDPLLPNSPYPYKYLSGTGVTFKLIQAIAASVGLKDLPFKFLDFVAVASAADIVPLTGENRILVKFGLEKLNSDPHPGFKALIEKAGLKIGKITTSNIVFGLAPRINAVGRLGDAIRAVKLLISKDYEEALTFAEILDYENRNRRAIDEEMFADAINEIESKNLLESNSALILHKNAWHIGVIGIVASRLVEKYYRPTILLTAVDGVLKGSARSIPDFNIYEALKKCSDLLLQFGGHKAAAGLSIQQEKLPVFIEQFNKILTETIPPDKFLPTLEIEAVVELNSITPKFRDLLEKFAPYGPQNMKPNFLTREVEIIDKLAVYQDKHLALKVRKNGSPVFDVIGFNLGEYINSLIDFNNNMNGKYIDIVYTIDSHTYNGFVFPQLRLKDLRLSKNKME